MLSLGKANQIRLLHRQMSTLLFLEKMKNGAFYFCCIYGNKQHVMHRNFFGSVYIFFIIVLIKCILWFIFLTVDQLLIRRLFVHFTVLLTDTACRCFLRVRSEVFGTCSAFRLQTELRLESARLTLYAAFAACFVVFPPWFARNCNSIDRLSRHVQEIATQ